MTVESKWSVCDPGTVIAYCRAIGSRAQDTTSTFMVQSCCQVLALGLWKHIGRTNQTFCIPILHIFRPMTLGGTSSARFSFLFLAVLASKACLGQMLVWYAKTAKASKPAREHWLPEDVHTQWHLCVILEVFFL